MQSSECYPVSPSPQAMEAELHLGKASVSVKCMWKERAQSPGNAGGKGAGKGAQGVGDLASSARLYLKISCITNEELWIAAPSDKWSKSYEQKGRFFILKGALNHDKFPNLASRQNNFQSSG